MRLYHGTTVALATGECLLPPSATGCVSERGRKVNLDRVFLTADEGLARIYAGRACRSIGGTPVVYECFVYDRDVVQMSDAPGATVYHASAAIVLRKKG